ncbi:MAG: hypothetical protein JNL88_02805 [Bacteroidia bacterium]|nr:hypothetical protein [Bacteroidia bacterium]
MYSLSEQQIAFILDDIRRNGVELEDLQLNLLDHICCIIEQELEENGDFGQFYSATVKKFYKSNLREIEEETKSLLIYKNYYTMKKIMLGSGIVSVSLLTMGLILKFLHLPGAAVGVVLGIGLLSLVFMPLMFTLKIREKSATRDKVLIVLGAVSAITLSLGVLFKIMFWPGANVLSLFSLALLLLVFLPFYFFTGIRNADTKINTIVSSILILTGGGLFLTLVRSPAGSRIMSVQVTREYLRNETLLDQEKLYIESAVQPRVNQIPVLAMGNKIYLRCEELKAAILEWETGFNTIGEDFEERDILLGDGRIDKFFRNNEEMARRIAELKSSLTQYNESNRGVSKKGVLPVQSILLDAYQIRTSEALNALVQIQLYLLHNERVLAMAG